MEKFIKNLARGAGAILRDGFRKKKSISSKQNFADPVTQYDLKSEKFIISKIEAKYPKSGILAEEGGHVKKGKDFFIVDPLDATRNFSRGIPIYCVIISYVKDDNVVYGAIYDPVHDELFFGEKGKQSTLNGKKIKVADTNKLERAIFSFSFATRPKAVLKSIFELEMRQKFWRSNLGCAGLGSVYTAAGRHDLVVQFGHHPWDYSASSLILEGAGAIVTDFSGKKYKWNSKSIVAANPVLHKQIMKELKK